jgi:hypothetical protein
MRMSIADYGSRVARLDLDGIDRRIDRMPGLAGLRLAEGALDWCQAA